MDLSELDPVNQAFLTASGLPAGRSSTTCGTSLLLAGEPLAAGDGRLGGEACVSRHFARACEALAVGPLRSPFLTEHVLPVCGALRRTRDIVTDACVAWDLTRHVDAATLIATELVSLTTRHASTMMSVTALLHQDTLYLWVRGGTETGLTPRFDATTNLSLLILHTVADHWGVMVDGDDTVIWAALRQAAQMSPRPAA